MKQMNLDGNTRKELRLGVCYEFAPVTITEGFKESKEILLDNFTRGVDSRAEIESGAKCILSQGWISDHTYQFVVQLFNKQQRADFDSFGLVFEAQRLYVHADLEKPRGMIIYEKDYSQFQQKETSTYEIWFEDDAGINHTLVEAPRMSAAVLYIENKGYKPVSVKMREG